MNDHAEIPVLVALRQQLVEGVDRATARRAQVKTRLRRTAAVGVAAAAAGTFAFAFVPTGESGRSTAAAFTVEVTDDGRIHVTMFQGFDQADQLAAELRDAGVGVMVNRNTAHPALVGTVEFPSHQLSDGGVERGTNEFWIDPDEFDGQVEMLVYVAPEPGEPWNQAPSVFHPDEPLGGLPCALDGPLSTQDLVTYARAAGIEKFTWIIWDRNALVHGGAQSDTRLETGADDPPPPGEVTRAALTNYGHLQVDVLPPEVVARDGSEGKPGMNFDGGATTEPECTPELRARWRDD